ncbi:MAG: hypothetical protein QOK42_188 [Frankiaceae bacterium]|jgi:hypothetical protein|nr:hypothetical protein [Frankiaceae bacterium]MDX6224354.1 hypothetical protein [Frankiales bacterium]MDX6275223.1 hypothetical protein [Frankiales bacterium]
MDASADAVTRDGESRGAEGEELTGHLEGPGGASWTVWLTVLGMIAATIVMGFGVIAVSQVLFWTGAVIFALFGLASLAAGIMRATH